MTKSTGNRKEITIETKRTTTILSRRTIVLRPNSSRKYIDKMDTMKYKVPTSDADVLTGVPVCGCCDKVGPLSRRPNV